VVHLDGVSGGDRIGDDVVGAKLFHPLPQLVFAVERRVSSLKNPVVGNIF
jgi:hypothetical protein